MREKRKKVMMIDVKKINVLNPRDRNGKIFAAIMENILQVGLKKPITVRPSRSKMPGKPYDLVCGQGRLEAFIACGQKRIPAFVIDVTPEDALIMSLVENCARRSHRTKELLQAVELLKRQGYTTPQIARKIGVTAGYIASILTLLERGEERLVAAVEMGQIPLLVANRIATASDGETQKVLREIYENKQLRGRKLLRARRIIEDRRKHGKSYQKGGRGRPTRRLSADQILREFRRDADAKHMDVRKAEAVNNMLMLVTASLRQLFRDARFSALLKTEGIATMPKEIAEFVRLGRKKVHG